ncbi:hypothetical protein BY996DRAFT_7201799 [Phakopsora pachyrhizi]|nr:hypothetical protein BY996DRAFT_7201799 [Phakopsora pachyrhizi]
MEEEEEVNRSIDESDKLRGERQERAAKVLQAQFRKYRSERENAGLSISSGARWHEAIKNQRRRSAHIQSGHEAKNDSHSRWQRAGLFATELVDRSSSQSSSLPNSPALDQSSPNSNRPSLYQQKTMDVRYWLEMVDQKHRYGANLKAYRLLNI